MLIKSLTLLTFAVFLFTISQVGMETSFGLSVKQNIAEIPYADKCIHFTLLTLLTFLLNASLGKKRVNLKGMKLLIGSLLVASVITLEEFSQAFIPSRNFELMDMVCNYAGIYAGGLLLCLHKQQQITTTNGGEDSRETFSIQTIYHRTGPLHDESRD